MNRWLVILLGVVFAHAASAQMFQNHEQITLSGGNRLDNPVDVRVDQTGNTLVFYAENRSYYPYFFEISFTKMINLSPRTAGEKRVLKHGITRILKLTISNDELEPEYAYTISYSMGDPSKQADVQHPYLIPIGPGKTFEPHTETSGQIKSFFINTFKTKPGDTLFAVRKGFITSLPDGNERTDQLDENTLEIIHEDGSIALYRNTGKSLVKYNQDVLPGQPIAIAGAEFISLNVYSLTEKQAKRLDLQFVVDEMTAKKFEDIPSGSLVVHPVTIIEKELSPREIKKLKKSKN